MTPTERRNDRKLLSVVAGAVAAGAVGIALLAGWSVQREAEQRETRSTAARSSHEPSPAAVPRPTPEATVLPASYRPMPEPPAAEPEIEPVEEVFTVDPDENFVARALEHYESRELDRAIAYLEAEIEARPERAWTHYMHGLALWKDGRLDEAAEAMARAAELDQGSIRTFINLSRIENDRRRFAAALAAAQTALAIDPEDATALFLEGRSLMNLDRLEEAAAALVRSTTIDPDNGYARNMLGLVRLRQERTADALTSFLAAAELRPEVAYIQNNLGMALELEGRAAEAVAAYRRAVGCDAGHEKAAANLARLEPTVPETPPVEDELTGEAVASGEAAVAADDGGVGSP